LEIFHSDKFNDSLIRTHFYIVNIQPYDPKEFVQGFCSKCTTTFSLKTYGNSDEKSNQIMCKTCKSKCELIYMVQFLIKDDSTENTDKFYRVLLYSFCDKGVQFFGGIKPVNLYKNKKTLELITKYVNMLTKFNIIIDGVLEKRKSGGSSEDFYMLIETELDRKFY
jgi:DNA-directed RNA polymerase subunit RPC12/RpoP